MYLALKCVKLTRIWQILFRYTWKEEDVVLSKIVVFYNRLSKILSWVRFQNRSHVENFGAELVLTILTTDLSVIVSLYSPLCSPVQALNNHSWWRSGRIMNNGDGGVGAVGGDEESNNNEDDSWPAI